MIDTFLPRNTFVREMIFGNKKAGQRRLQKTIENKQ
jgi:hypothetical protein